MQLATQPQDIDQPEILGAILALQVSEKPCPLADQHEETATTRVILLHGEKMFRDVPDPLGEDRDLDLNRSFVAVGGTKLLDQLGLALGSDAHEYLKPCLLMVLPTGNTPRHSAPPIQAMDATLAAPEGKTM